MTPYRSAIDATIVTIDRRATFFRNHVVSVVVIVLLVGASSVALRTPEALSALLLLVPASGLAFFADHRLLHEWRGTVLEAWIAGDVDLEAWRPAVRSHPMLPPETLESMLATLPSSPDLTMEQGVLRPTREAIAAAIQCTNRMQLDSVLFRAALSMAIVSAMVASLWLRSWSPLLGFVLAGALPLGRQQIARQRRAQSAEKIAGCRAQKGFSEDEFLTMIGRLR